MPLILCPEKLLQHLANFMDTFRGDGSELKRVRKRTERGARERVIEGRERVRGGRGRKTDEEVER